MFSRGLECVSTPLGFFARLSALVCLYEFPSVRFRPVHRSKPSLLGPVPAPFPASAAV